MQQAHGLHLVRRSTTAMFGICSGFSTVLIIFFPITLVEASVALAGNVVFCRVFPSLHLQTWRVDMSLVMSPTQENVVSARGSKQHYIWRHVSTCGQLLWTQTKKCIVAKKVPVRLGWFVLFGCNWYKLGIGVSLLCRNDTQCRPRFGDIDTCRWHVGDIVG